MITARDNSLLRHARAVRDGKVEESIFVEGLRLCEEALQSGLHIEAVIYSEEIAKKERAAAFLEKVASVCDRRESVSENLLGSISYTKTPQGLIILAQRPASGPDRLEANPPAPALLVILHGINNPVNVGAILRSAEAAGATGIITTTTTSDPFSPKALRGAMGSAFRLPVWSGVEYESAIAWCAARNIQTLCADLRASRSYTETDWTVPRALILGPESTGLTPDEVAAAGETVSVPMHGDVESLNVAVAAGIILYEAARQRSM
jgi:TrmH family RNA methyltransferase